MDGYNNECPTCKSQINLVGFKGSCNIPVEKDGWDYGSGGIDSEEEIFRCSGCGHLVPSDYVFGWMSRREAAARMRSKIY